MIYHQIALNTILPPLNYSHHLALPVGRRVLVSLRGKMQVGVVWRSDVAPEIDPNKVLPIETVFADEPLLPEMWLDFIAFVARYYHYPIGQTLFTALPSVLKENQAIIAPTPTLYYQLNDLGKSQTPPPAKQKRKFALWQALCNGEYDAAALKKLHPQAMQYLQDYRAQNWLDEYEMILPPIAASHHILNDEQITATQSVRESLGQYQTFLLHGITGSGKTEVYFDIMAQVLAQGKQVLFLLPEINLTPQLLTRIAQRFPKMPTAVLHSQTATKQRGEDYLRAMLGQAKLIVGTRLAVFTPLANVGLIVVDEEHDASFKQDNELRYHARDLAIWRAHQVACPIVLGSATPSLETWQKAQSGAYQLLTLSQRAYSSAQLPDIQMIDVRNIKLDNGFSPIVLQKLRENQQRGGLSLVYLNRRGFAPALFCSDCGHIFACPNCSAKMVLHQRIGQLRCHHCDYRQVIPRACSECGNQDLTALGQGTQRIEEALRHYLPDANILRVDRDSTSKKDDWTDIYKKIYDNQVDILVGTQMLAKGHDFARLNLVVVLNADGSLFSNDFRAPERLFAELMQVSGRAGRAQHRGHVYIQTQLPEHAVFAAVKSQNFAQFAAQELAQRKAFALPPFGYQAAVRADAARIRDAEMFLNEMRDVIAPLLPPQVAQLGAVPMQMTRLAQRERAQIFVESTDRVALHRALAMWAQMLHSARASDIRWHIDVDCQDM